MVSALAIAFRAEYIPELNVDEDGDGEAAAAGATPEEEAGGEDTMDPRVRSTEDGVGMPFGTLACREADRSISAANGETSGL